MKLFTLIIFVFPFLAFSQLMTSTASTPTALVQNTLLGPGVQLLSVSYNGDPQAIGRFTAFGTNLGINEGIVMTTGTVLNNGSGPHGPNNSPSSGVNNNRPGYTPLNNILGANLTNNAAILEFTFIPYADTVRFKYVFGSEEYREWVDSKFNDIFAFFISGPGIPLGPGGGAMNIAKLPNGTPVTINNINDGTEYLVPSYQPACNNCAYFNYNGGGSHIQYDGFTKPLEAFAKVECGKTYKLVIAIADVNDGIFDSGIFLEANSLTSKEPITITQQLSYEAFGDPKMMAEGCVSSTVTLNRTSGNINVPLTIPITVTGTATAVADYTNIPSSVTFAAGQTSLQFTFSALEDGIVEGIETLNLNFTLIDPCGNATQKVLNLTINDVQPLTVQVDPVTIECAGDAADLIANIAGGSGPYTYAWSTGSTDSVITVNPMVTTTYTVSVIDFCLLTTVTVTVTVTVPINPPLVATPSPNITEICPYVPKTIFVTPTGGSGTYTYQWYGGLDTLGTQATQDVLPSTTTTYIVVVTDKCGETTTTQVTYTITSPPLLIQVSLGKTVCPGDSVLLSVSATGGYGQYYYDWIGTGKTSSSIWVNPMTTTTYVIAVSDECQTFDVRDEIVITVIKPVANFQIVSSPIFDGLPITFQNLTSGGVSYQWTFGDGNSSTMVHPNNTYNYPDTYIVTLIATNVLGCKDTLSRPIKISQEHYIYVPNAFTPDGNKFNNVFYATTVNIKELNVKIFNRWGETLYESNEVRFIWDGTYNGVIVKDDVYVYKIKYVTNEGEEDTLVGHIVLLK
jgi:gliding motility-associated-like protein